MNSIIEKLEEIKQKLTSRTGGDIDNRYCLICKNLLEKPDFTCGHPQCNRELVEKMERLDIILESWGKKTISGLDDYIEKLRDDLEEALDYVGVKCIEDLRTKKESPMPPEKTEEEEQLSTLFDALGVDSFEEAQEKIAEMEYLADEISKKIK